MDAVILEQLDRHHRVKSRSRVDRFPFTVGRAYDNDLIIDDEYVSLNHFALEQDEQGQIFVVDRGSTNGLFDLSRGKLRVERLPVSTDTVIRIGHTLLRLRPLEFTHAPTKVDRLTNISLNRLIDSRPGMLLVIGAALAAFFLRVFVPDYSDRSGGKLFFDEVLPLFVLVFLWSGVWAIISYINSHRSYFAVHVAIASLVFVLGDYIVLAEDVARFGFAFQEISAVASYGIVALISFVLLYGHLRFCSSRSPRTIAYRALAASVLLNGVYVAGEYVRTDDFSQIASYHSSLYPASFQWREGMSLESWGETAKELASRVQQDLERDEKKN